MLTPNNSRERIANRENELSKSRERITNPLERIGPLFLFSFLEIYSNLHLTILRKFRESLKKSSFECRKFKFVIFGSKFKLYLKHCFK